MPSERKAEGKFIINGAKIQLKVQRYKEEDWKFIHISQKSTATTKNNFNNNINDFLTSITFLGSTFDISCSISSTITWQTTKWIHNANWSQDDSSINLFLQCHCQTHCKIHCMNYCQIHFCTNLGSMYLDAIPLNIERICHFFIWNYI